MTRKEMEQLLLSEVSADRLMEDARYITSEDRESEIGRASCRERV